jgi:hypothetical protein
MEQRRLRLGDILDDYCPRERRVTNHAIVAMIEEDVKQTRCTTCDAEHAYKGGQAPRRRKKETAGALYREVLAGMSEPEAVPVLAPPSSPASDEPETPEVAAAPASDPAPHEDEPPPSGEAEEGPVHRRLIRATLPRPEGQKAERPLPEFTARHAASRFNGNRNGNRSRPQGGGGGGLRAKGGGRFGGRSSGRGDIRSGGGFRSAGPQRAGGRKRSR